METIFDTPEALRLNKARMEHLWSLKEPMQGFTGLEVGCGVGKLTGYFASLVSNGNRTGLDCAEARGENIEEFKRRDHGSLVVWQWDVNRRFAFYDTLGSLISPVVFDVVFCYGLLYHLEHPLLGLRNVATVTRRLLLIESQVSDSQLPLVVYERESNQLANQTIGEFGCRPSSAFIVQTLESCGFKVEIPVTQPEHEDFQWAEKNNLEWQRDGHPLRRVFIARRV